MAKHFVWIVILFVMGACSSGSQKSASTDNGPSGMAKKIESSARLNGLQASPSIRTALELLSTVSNLDATNAAGKSPLWMALLEANYPSLVILVEAGAGIDSQDFDGNSPIMFCLLHPTKEYQKIGTYLKSKRPNLNLSNRAGQRAIDIAKKNNDIFSLSFQPEKIRKFVEEVIQ